MNFSELQKDFVGEQHPLYRLRDKLLLQGADIIDLVGGNVTEHGLTFPNDLLKNILIESAAEAAVYHPDPLGQPSARNAIAQYYSSLAFDKKQIVITPGTSISYWYCFKLLCQAGDEVICPSPSYPLLDYIARLCDVTLTNYRLDESRAWSIDFADLHEKINDRTRAIVLISPHNPTGMVCTREELSELADIASRHQLPIISDEVFSEFLFDLNVLPRPAQTSAPLVFTLNGLSKSFALPGMKVGWIAVSGEQQLVQRSLAVLEMISDTFLPVNEIAQFAVPKILECGSEFLTHYKDRVTNLRNAAVETIDGIVFSAPRGGFYLTVQAAGDEEQIAEDILMQHNILVHPGHFYEMEGSHLVFTFIHDEIKMRHSLRCIQPLLKRFCS